MFMFVRCALLGSLLAICSMWPAAASAQKYPDKVVRYIVTDQPGSGLDVLARIVAERLSLVFGQQVIVDNRSGAGGNIGAEIGAKAPADGYTLVQLATTHAVNVSLYKNLPYDFLRDFAPVTLLASSPSVVVVPASSTIISMTDLIKQAKDKPGAVHYASAGVGTCTFLATELFKKQTGVDMLHVPYKGGAPALTAVMSGESAVYFAPLSSALPQIKQGRLRALAVTSPKPLELLPGYPTVASAAASKYEFSCWYGLFVPARTPQHLISSIHAALVTVLNDPGVRKRLDDLGFIPGGNRPSDFAAYVRSEVETARDLVKNIPPY